MSNLRQAAQQALEALESGDWYIDQLEMIVYYADDTGTHEERAKVQAAITALKQALAEPQTTHWEGCEAVHPECRKTEQEPVCDKDPGGCWNVRCQLGKVCKNTAPTPRKPLTDAEIWNTYKNLWMFHPAEEPRLAGDVLKFARAIERKHGIGEQT